MTTGPVLAWSGHEAAIAFSPDGTRLFGATSGSVWSTDDGARVGALTRIARAQHADWSPEGVAVLGLGGEIARFDHDRAAVPSRIAAAAGGAFCPIRWRPGTREIWSVSYDLPGGGMRPHVVVDDGEEVRRVPLPLGEGWLSVDRLAFCPDGTVAFVGTGKRGPDAAHGAALVLADPALASTWWGALPESRGRFALRPDDVRRVAHDRVDGVAISVAGASEPEVARRLPWASKGPGWPAWSPDGRALAIAFGEGFHLFDAALGARAFRRMRDPWRPLFSPDGARVALLGLNHLEVWSVAALEAACPPRRSGRGPRVSPRPSP